MLLQHSCNCDKLQGGCCYVLAIGWLELVQNKRERSMVMLLWAIVLGLCAAEYVHHEAGLQGCRAAGLLRISKCTISGFCFVATKQFA